MIFWALIVIAGLITIGAILYGWEDGGLGDAFMFGLIGAFFSGLAGGLILLLCLLIPATHIRPHHYPLASLGTTQGVTGEFFLGSGLVNGTRELTYVKQDGDHYVATEAQGDASYIYQDATGPSVTEYEWFYANWWVLPWNFDTGWSYDFHVPKGTILNDFRIGG